MQRRWIAALAAVTVGVLGMAATPGFAATVRTTELLSEAQNGPAGWTPAYLEVSAPTQEDPFDVLVVDIVEYNVSRVVSVTTVTPSALHKIHVIHEGEWPNDHIDPARVSVDNLGLFGPTDSSARAILTYDHTTDFTIHSTYEAVADAGGWSDALLYNVGGATIDPAWDGYDVLTLEAGEAIYRSLDPGGGQIVEAVGETFTFSNGDKLDPAMANPATIETATEPVVMPEPSSSALFALTVMALAAGRSRARAGHRLPGRATPRGD